MSESMKRAAREGEPSHAHKLVALILLVSTGWALVEALAVRAFPTGHAMLVREACAFAAGWAWGAGRAALAKRGAALRAGEEKGSE